MDLKAIYEKSLFVKKKDGKETIVLIREGNKVYAFDEDVKICIKYPFASDRESGIDKGVGVYMAWPVEGIKKTIHALQMDYKKVAFVQPKALLQKEMEALPIDDPEEMAEHIKTEKPENIEKQLAPWKFKHKRSGQVGAFSSMGFNETNQKPFIILNMETGLKARPYLDTFDQFYTLIHD